MRFVALKSEAQLDVQVLHRLRDRLVGQRTSLAAFPESTNPKKPTATAVAGRALSPTTSE